METLLELMPSKKLWYDDGNVVLVAGNRAFRIHRGVLSQHSPVFRDMFAVPQPTSDIAIGGRPVVRLQDDPLHLEFLLGAMYDRSFFSGAEKLSRLAELAAGILTLSHKYDMQPLYEEAVYRITENYPATFKSFRAMEHFMLDPFNPAQHVGVIFLINAARRLQTPELIELLPVLFYLCCLLDGPSLADGISRENGTMEKLSTEDLRRCISAKEELLQANGGATQRLGPFTGNMAEDCKSTDACMSALILITRDALETDIFAACDALTVLDPWVTEEGAKHGLCRRCTETLLTRYCEAQETIWESLVDIFELEDDVRVADRL